MFKSLASPDGKRQKYIVYRITKEIKGSNDLTHQQLADLRAQGRQKYPDNYYNRHWRKEDVPAGIVNIDAGLMKQDNASLRLTSSFGSRFPSKIDKDKDGFVMSDRMHPDIFKNFPGCGGDRKIKL